MEPSEAARAVRREAEDDLLRLQEAGGLGWGLVGLTVAAGGGLSAYDLAELVERPRRLVERELSAVSGRSFQWRAGQWDAEGPGVYLLAHEEIRRSAEELMERRELAEHRERLHRWAEGHRAGGWPAGTPEYLLRGYGRMLGELGDEERLVELVTDRARQERLWEVSGSDFDALGELSSAIEKLVVRGRERGEASVERALRITVSRDGLHRLADRVPAELISSWAKLGHLDRAFNMALSHGSRYLRIDALTEVAQVLARAGEVSRAMAVADGLDSATDRDTCREWIAYGLLDAGKFREAWQLGRGLADDTNRANVLTVLLEAMADAGVGPEHRELVEAVAHAAETATKGVEASAQQAELLAAQGAAQERLGDERRAQELLRQAESILGSEPEPGMRADGFAGIVRQAAGAPGLQGVLRRCQQAAVAAVALAVDPEDVAFSVPNVAAALAEGGFRQEARALVEQSELTAEDRAYAIARIGAGQAGAGDVDGAMVVLDGIKAPEDRWLVWNAIVRRMLCDGRIEEAVAMLLGHGPVLVPQLDAAYLPALVVAEMADLLGQAGRDREASDLLSTAAATVRRKARVTADSRTLAEAAAVLGRLGHRRSALRLARHAHCHVRSRDGQLEETRDLVAVALGLHAAGFSAEARSRLEAEAEHLGQLEDFELRADPLLEVASAFAAMGDRGAAERAAAELLAVAAAPSSTVGLWHRILALQAYVVVGQPARCLELAEELDGWPAAVVRGRVAESLVDLGELDLAEALVMDVRDQTGRCDGVEAVLRGAATAGDLARAEAWLTRLESAELKDQAAPYLVACLADNGRWSAARELADGLTRPANRARALAMMAARRGPSPEGRVLLAEALALAPWDELVEEFARVAPELVPLLVDLVLESGN